MKKLLQNRIVVGALMFLLMDLAGGFLVLAPFLISVRNIYERSSMARGFWPAPQSDLLIDILVNSPQMLSTAAIAAFTIYLLFVILRTYFAGGIYRVIIEGHGFERGGDPGRSGHTTARPGGFQEFLARSSQTWAGFAKIAAAAIAVYTVAGFLGFTVGRVFSGLGQFWMIALFLFVMLIASTYLQVLKIGVVVSDDNSVVNAMKGTRQVVAKSVPRLVLGNLSVVIVAVLISMILWLIIKAVRGGEWSPARAAITVILEQAIVLVACLAQALRINFNHSIIKKGAQDAVGGTELGGV